MARLSLLLCFLFLAIINSSFILHSSALQFSVGGQDGWVVKPKESYDHWSQRLRFLVNDTLHFRYSNTTDSVLVVSQSDYDNCNVNNPVIQLYGGNSVFQFGHSGPFYFITGNKTNCDQGQKLVIRVLAIRSPPASPTTPPAQTPTSPPSGAPSPAGSVPPSSSPSPTGSVPPSSSPSPTGSVPPTSSPSPSGSVPPSSSPSPSSFVPPSSSPASSPTAQSPTSTSTPGGSPSGSVSPTSPVGPGGGNTPADVNAPTGSPNTSSATATFTQAVSTLTVSFVFIMALGWSFVL